jgi:hypothetical protein
MIFWQFTFLHILTHVLLNKSKLSIHEVKVAVPGLGNGYSVGQHTYSLLYVYQVTCRDRCWRLIVDADLEASWTPVYRFDGMCGHMLAISALISFCIISPWYSMQYAIYFPHRGWHFSFWLAGSKQAFVISDR